MVMGQLLGVPRKEDAMTKTQLKSLGQKMKEGRRKRVVMHKTRGSLFYTKKNHRHTCLLLILCPACLSRTSRIPHNISIDFSFI